MVLSATQSTAICRRCPNAASSTISEVLSLQAHLKALQGTSLPETKRRQKVVNHPISCHKPKAHDLGLTDSPRNVDELQYAEATLHSGFGQREAQSATIPMATQVNNTLYFLFDSRP